MASNNSQYLRFYKFESMRIEWSKYFEKASLYQQARIVKDYFQSFFIKHKDFALTVASVFDDTRHVLFSMDQYALVKRELEEKLSGKELPTVRGTDLTQSTSARKDAKIFGSYQKYESFSLGLRRENNRIRDRHRAEAQEHARDLRTTATANKRFLAYDLEMYECDGTTLLEIGSVLFTLESQDTPRYFHAIITDNISIKNHEYVPDNRENFRFGTSVRMSLKEAAAKLQEEVSDADYLLTHAGKNDEIYLERNAVHISGKKMFDTQLLALALLRKGPNCWGLKGILEELNVPYEGGILHNAGNDAHYTMEVFKRLAKRA